MSCKFTAFTISLSPLQKLQDHTSIPEPVYRCTLSVQTTLFSPSELSEQTTPNPVQSTQTLRNSIKQHTHPSSTPPPLQATFPPNAIHQFLHLPSHLLSTPSNSLQSSTQHHQRNTLITPPSHLRPLAFTKNIHYPPLQSRSGELSLSGLDPLIVIVLLLQLLSSKTRALKALNKAGIKSP